MKDNRDEQIQKGTEIPKFINSLANLPCHSGLLGPAVGCSSKPHPGEEAKEKKEKEKEEEKNTATQNKNKK